MHLLKESDTIMSSRNIYTEFVTRVRQGDENFSLRIPVDHENHHSPPAVFENQQSSPTTRAPPAKQSTGTSQVAGY